MTEIKNISKSFNGKSVLNNFSLNINDGEKIMLFGPSGCGKTTLLKILLGIYKADSGSFVIEKCSAVFQENRLVDGLSAVANVMLVMKKRERKKAEELLLSLLPKDSIDVPVCNLSGGMKRRVAIARALAYECPVLIMDEPFAGLDDGTKEITAKFILSQTVGKTVIFVSHDKEDADLLGASIIKMK